MDDECDSENTHPTSSESLSELEYMESEASNDQDAENADEDENADESYSRDEGGMRKKWVEIIDKDNNSRKIWLKRVLDISDSLCGRGTTVWEGNMDSEPSDPVVVKDTWTDPLRKYTEGMILHILEKHQIEGVPTLVSEQQVKTSLRDPTQSNTVINQSMHFLRSALPRGSVFDLQTLSRLVSRPLCKLIFEFSSVGELLVAYLDHVVGKLTFIS